MNIPELIVTGIECSFSYTLANKKLLNPMLNYITRAFISKNKGMHVYVKGVQSKRYKKCQVYLSVGRKRTTEHEKDAIKQFNALIKEHSLDAVKNIVKISNRAMDENVRLKANVWIAEKLVGKSYSIADVEGNVQDKDINIVLNVKNATTNDSESWNDDTSELDNWGEDDIYK